MKYIVDSSVMHSEPGVRVLDSYRNPNTVGTHCLIGDWWGKEDVQNWVEGAKIGDFMDFGPFTIFVAGE